MHAPTWQVGLRDEAGAPGVSLGALLQHREGVEARREAEEGRERLNGGGLQAVDVCSEKKEKKKELGELLR